MLNKKITDLPTVNELNSTDKLLISNSAATYNVTVSTLKSAVQDGAIQENWGASNAGKVLVVGNDGNVGLINADEVSTTVRPLTVSKNGTYTAPAKTAYNPVVVNVEGGGSDITVQSLTVTSNGTYNAPAKTAYDSVNVHTPCDDELDVRFYSSDGTMVYYYSKNEFLNLSSMPDLPESFDEGPIPLNSRSWNWNLTDAQNFVRAYGCLDIGESGNTFNGSCYFITNIDDDTPQGRMNFELGFNVDYEDDTTISWDDETETDGYTKDHVYEAPGNYNIKVTLTNGNIYFGGFEGYSIFGAADEYSQYQFLRISNIALSDDTSTINSYAFQYCFNLNFITIPAGITSIGDYAFRECYNLIGINIPYGVTNIGDYAFADCRNLKYISLPNTIISIGEFAFENCVNLERIILPDSVTNIGDYAFSNCASLQFFRIPGNNITLGTNIFQYCKGLMSIQIPYGVTSIPSYTFMGCEKVNFIIIPNTVTEIGYYAFNNTYPNSVVINGNHDLILQDKTFGVTRCLEYITLTGSITSIGNAAFSNLVSLRTINIPNTVINIGANAFSYCYSLLTIYIPSSVQSIGDMAFRMCLGLKEIHFQSSLPPTIYRDTFEVLPEDCTIYIPTGTLSAYTSAANYPDPNTYTYVEE